MARVRSLGGDVWSAAAMAAAGIALLIYEWHNPSGIPVFGVSPGTVPMAATAAVAGLSLALLAQSLAAQRTAHHRSRSEEWQAPNWRAYALGLLCIAYVFTMPWLGYIATSALFVGALAWLFGNRRPLAILIMMIATPFALSFFFQKAMVVYLPTSRLFE
jgi:hypothetical protein